MTLHAKGGLVGDPSLRLKGGSAQDDAVFGISFLGSVLEER
jgi:hypothetical protein